MKQSTFILKSLCLLALSLIFACQKPDPEPSNYVQPTDPYHTLPEITQEGKNTFGCLMNGVVWVPRVEIFVPWYTLDFQFNTGNGNITCRVLTTTQDDFLQVTFGPTNNKPGTFNVKPSNNTSMYLLSMSKDYVPLLKDSMFNRVKVNFIDTDYKIVSGEFQFKLYNNSNPKDTISVTNGRFDLHY